AGAEMVVDGTAVPEGSVASPALGGSGRSEGRADRRRVAGDSRLLASKARGCGRGATGTSGAETVGLGAGAGCGADGVGTGEGFPPVLSTRRFSLWLSAGLELVTCSRKLTSGVTGEYTMLPLRSWERSSDTFSC